MKKDDKQYKQPAPAFLSKTDHFFDTHKMIGAYFPIPVSDHLALHCALHQVSRSKIITEVITKYIDNLDPVSELMQTMIDKCVEEWLKMSIKKRTQRAAGWRTDMQFADRWDEYKEGLRRGLTTKKLSTEHIDQIINAVEESFK